MGQPLKLNEYYIFTRWIALPEFLRDPSTQKELAQKLKVDADTLSNWKHDPNFWDDVDRALRDWAKHQKPNVIAGLAKRAIKSGDPFAVKLWLQYFEGFTEKAELNQTVTHKIEISEERRVLILNAFANFGLLKDDTNKTNSGAAGSAGDIVDAGAKEGGG